MLMFGWEPIIINLLCYQLVRIVQTAFIQLSRSMRMEQIEVNVLKRQILIPSGRVLKQCYLHNNMNAD